jgi:hypothetical protein
MLSHSAAHAKVSAAPRPAARAVDLKAVKPARKAGDAPPKAVGDDTSWSEF